MRRHILLGLAAIGAALGLASLHAEAAEETGVLKDFVGQWRVEYGPTSKPKSQTALMTSKWALGKSYVLSKLKAPGEPENQLIILWAYNANKQEYRRWFFFASGTTIEETGQYDPATKTLRFERVGGRGESTVRIIDENTKHWTMEFPKPGGGGAVIEGTTTRRD
jgi:hypothetical protein